MTSETSGTETSQNSCAGTQRFYVKLIFLKYN